MEGKDMVKNKLMKRADKIFSFHTQIIPGASEDIFTAYVDNDCHFDGVGDLRKGSLMFFDGEKEFDKKMPSCFINKETGALRVMDHKMKGYKHLGRMIAVMNFFG